MADFLLLVVIALVIAAIVFGTVAVISGHDSGLAPAEPDSVARDLPSDRPLEEPDVQQLRFDTAVRGYRMDQVDRALARIAYDIGFKSEMLQALEAEVTALREGRLEDAEALRQARLAALGRDAEASASTQPSADQPASSADEDTVEVPESWNSAVVEPEGQR